MQCVNELSQRFKYTHHKDIECVNIDFFVWEKKNDAFQDGFHIRVAPKTVVNIGTSLCTYEQAAYIFIFNPLPQNKEYSGIETMSCAPHMRTSFWHNKIYKNGM